MAVPDRWLLPAGIEEVLPGRAAELESARRALLDLFHRWGYDLVMPPLIEYLESLLTGAGGDLDLQTFKLIDQLSGRMMGVRADMTPQVARIDAQRLRREEPVRLCYMGTVLHTRPAGFSGSRSPLQVGAELYGHAGIESDVEILCLLLETLAAVQVDAVHLDLGHVGIFRALAREAGIGEEQEAVLFDALQRKAEAEIDELLGGWGVDSPVRDAVAALSRLNGGPEVLEQAWASLSGAGSAVHRALEELAQVASALATRMPGAPVYVDLAELRGYHYHAGVVFAAFVPGHGQEIARGGRYEEVGRLFGRPRPATGFSTDLKTLVALARADAPPAAPGGIWAPGSSDPALVEAVRRLRADGERVVQELPGQAGDGRSMGCDRRLHHQGEGWSVVSLKE